MDPAFRDRTFELIPKLRAHALLLTGSCSDADQIVQETLIRAWRSWDGGKAGASSRGWLFGVLREVVLARSSQRRSPVMNELTCPAEAADPKERARAEALFALLEPLDEAARQALLMVVGAGLTCEEAAEACGCSVAIIKLRVIRGRSQLARLGDVDKRSARADLHRLLAAAP